MSIRQHLRRLLSWLVLIFVLTSQGGCAPNNGATEGETLSWDSIRLRSIENEWKALQDTYSKTPESIPGKLGKGKHEALEKMVDKLLKSRFSDRDWRQLACSIPAKPASGFVDRAAMFMVRYFADHGDRKSLVVLLSRHCPDRVRAYDTVEFYLVSQSDKLADPVLILGDAYSRCQTTQTRTHMSWAVRRSFAGFKIEGEDNDSYVHNAMQWYKKNKATLKVNAGYRLNETIMPTEAQELSPDKYAEFLRSPKRQPLFQRKGGTARIEAPAHHPASVRASPPAPCTNLTMFSLNAASRNENLNALDGIWEVVQVTDNGAQIPVGKLRDSRFIVDHGTLKIIAPDGAMEREFRVLYIPQGLPAAVDLLRVPSALDCGETTPLIYELQEETTAAIYDIEGDTLRLCLPRLGSRRRPLSFKAEKGSMETFFILKRQVVPIAMPENEQSPRRQVGRERNADAPRPLRETTKNSHESQTARKPALQRANASKGGDALGESEIVFRLVDEKARTVAGAEAGAYYSFFVQRDSDTDDTRWKFQLLAKSDADGTVRLNRVSNRFPPYFIARHERRGLIALKKIEADRHLDAVEVKMSSECFVSGTLKCEELDALSRGVGWTNEQLSINSHVIMEYRSPDGNFHFYLPPGDYLLGIMGNDIKYTRVLLRVPPGQAKLLLGDVPVSASGFALLVGKPAPELRWVDAWKNTPLLTLADLRGKWVLLTFAGTWGNAGGSFGGQQMRELLAVYDKYKERGLVILAVYWYRATAPPMNLLQDFESKIAVAAKQEWGGRELPFPIALTSKIVRVNSGGMVTDAIRADYGIVGWPPSVLIDPAGIIAGGIDVRTVDGIALLDRLIGPKQNPESRNGTPLDPSAEPGVRRNEKGGRTKEEERATLGVK